DSDDFGQAFWVTALEAGATRQQVAQGFWESAEHRGLQVDGFYASYLHRAADSFGRAFWVDTLLSGAGETDVTRRFLTSPEYTAAHPTADAFIEGINADLLGGQLDPQGVARWEGLARVALSHDLVARAF